MAKHPTALERYEAAGIHWTYVGRKFPAFSDYDYRFEDGRINEDRDQLVEIFAKQRNELPAETVAMIGSHVAITGLTFDELLWQHWHSGWNGGMTVSERQRRAAYKAWETIRARKKQARIEEETREVEGDG